MNIINIIVLLFICKKLKKNQEWTIRRKQISTPFQPEPQNENKNGPLKA